MLENIDLISTVGLGLLAIVFPYLAPVKYAKYINLIGGAIKGTKVVIDALDKASRRIEDSKGGLSPELAKEHIKETAMDMAVKKLKDVVDPNNKSEMVTEKNLKDILETVSKSKGVEHIQSKIANFAKSL